MSEKTYYDKDGKVIKRVFTIPVGNLSREDAEKQIKNIMNSYKDDVEFSSDVDYKFSENMLKDRDIWLPVKDDNSEWGSIDYMTEEDIWNELSESEKKERLLPKEEQLKNLEKIGWTDWNQLSLDELADYLDKKWMFSSSGDALAIHKMVKFYRENKDKV